MSPADGRCTSAAASRMAAPPTSSSGVTGWPRTIAAQTTAATGSASITSAVRVPPMRRTPMSTSTLGMAAPTVPARITASHATGSATHAPMAGRPPLTTTAAPAISAPPNRMREMAWTAGTDV